MTTTFATPRSCTFCGAGPLTREHIMPQWLREFFPQTKQKLDPEDRMVVKHVREGLPGLSILEFEDRGPITPVQDKTVKVVCADCNGGWMSALELQMKRLYGRLADGKYTLTQSDADVMSRWTHKTSMMWARHLPNPPLDESQQVAAVMAGTEVPGSLVRMIKRPGRHSGSLQLHSFQVGVRVPQEFMTEPGDALHPTIMFGTVTFVRLGNLVLLGGLAIKHTEPILVETFDKTRRWSRPLAAGVQWPGGLRAVPDVEFERLHEIFRGDAPDIEAKDPASRPNIVIFEEQRKRALEMRRKKRGETPPKQS